MICVVAPQGVIPTERAIHTVDIIVACGLWHTRIYLGNDVFWLQWFATHSTNNVRDTYMYLSYSHARALAWPERLIVAGALGG
jgi:hypothetical protein